MEWGVSALWQVIRGSCEKVSEYNKQITLEKSNNNWWTHRSAYWIACKWHWQMQTPCVSVWCTTFFFLLLLLFLFEIVLVQCNVDWEPRVTCRLPDESVSSKFHLQCGGFVCLKKGEGEQKTRYTSAGERGVRHREKRWRRRGSYQQLTHAQLGTHNQSAHLHRQH